MNVPDVFTAAAATRQLATVVGSVTEDLDPYSRYLGRNPEGRGSLAAAALLPADLASEPSREVAELREWAQRLTDTGKPTTGADLMGRWPTKSPERIAKNESVTLSQLLSRQGFGIEPDVRVGGPAITPNTPVVVFRTGPQPPHAATPAYAAAATLLHLATAVSAADGHVSTEEQAHRRCCIEPSCEAGTADLPVGCLATSPKRRHQAVEDDTKDAERGRVSPGRKICGKTFAGPLNATVPRGLAAGGGLPGGVQPLGRLRPHVRCRACNPAPAPWVRHGARR